MTGQKKARAKLVVALAWTLQLVGCAVGPNFQRPEPAAKRGFPDQSLGQTADGVQQTGRIATEVRADWWTLLGSSKLNAIVREALAQNWNLASREAALERARQELAGVRGENYPSLNATAQVGQTRIGATAFGSDALNFPIFSSYGIGLAVSYDPDVFGGRSRRIEEAAADVEAQLHERDAASLTLIANVVLQAIQIALAKREIALAESIVGSDQQILDLVSRAYSAGAAPNIDVVQISAQLDHDRALLPALRQRLQAAGDALATLVGKSPTDRQSADFELSDFSLPSALPTTVPSVLARQRPDILAAEARLHAANAAIGVATANLYPSFDLSAVVSREGLLGGPSEAAWSLLGGAVAPIFNGGRLVAAKRGAEATYRASFADYQDVVITALGQVADGLNALANDADALTAQENALSSAGRSLDLNREGYAAGSADLTRVLDAQRLLDQAQVGVAEAQIARLADTVRLFLALGLHPPIGLDPTAGGSSAASETKPANL
jgi:NodT family efflux transporter outer membrane factor (OMF) lipoprotein